MVEYIITIVLLGGILIFREIQHARRDHELTDRIQVRSLGELTSHELATSRPSKQSSPLSGALHIQGLGGDGTEAELEPAEVISMVDAQAAHRSLMGS